MNNLPAPIIGEVEWFKRMAVPAPSSRRAGAEGREGRAPSKAMQNQMWRVMGGSNAAVFKKIRNAGTHHPKQLAGQMAYLNGKADLIFGNGIQYELGDTALEGAAVQDMIEDWSEGWKGQPKNGHTTHLVLSFPGYVTGEQAGSIVEEWCHDMFQAVDAGLDEWSYYAAVHMDQPHHPHVHVIVNNRGLRQGDWFYMAEGHDFSYQNMKQRMVEVSETYGIYLDATSRLERGVIEYAPRNDAYRRAIRMGIEPKGRAREGEVLDKAYATLKAYAEQCRALATVAQSIEHSEMADLLRAAAVDLEEARPVYVPEGTKMEIDLTEHPADIRDALNAWALKNEIKIAALKPHARAEVTDQLHKTLDHIETVLDKDYQVTWTPPAAQTPAFAQPFADVVIGDGERLYALATQYEGYVDGRETAIARGVQDEVARLRAEGHSKAHISERSLEIKDAVAKRVAATQLAPADISALRNAGVLEHYVNTGEKLQGWESHFEAVEAAYGDLSTGSLADGLRAMETIRNDARNIGLDPDLLQSRMERGALNAREEQEWLVNDIEAALDFERLDATNDAHVSQATAVVRALQNSIAATIDELHNRHYEVNQIELRTAALQVAREVETFGVSVFDSPEAGEKFMQQMRATYGAVGLMEIANGGHAALKDITGDAAQQRAIVYTMLQHEARHHTLGLSPQTIKEGLELNSPRSGHESDGHSI